MIFFAVILHVHYIQFFLCECVNWLLEVLFLQYKYDDNTDNKTLINVPRTSKGQFPLT
jgi:hypothetical protein